MDRYSWKRKPNRIFEQNITSVSHQCSNSYYDFLLDTLDFSIEMGFIFLDNKSLPMSLSVLGIFNIMQNYLRIIGVKRSNTFHISCLYEVCTYILVPGSEFNNWNSSWKQLAGLMQSLMQSVPIDATRPLQPKEFWVSRRWRQFLTAVTVSSANNLPYYNQHNSEQPRTSHCDEAYLCSQDNNALMSMIWKCDKWNVSLFALSWITLGIPSLGISWNARETNVNLLTILISCCYLIASEHIPLFTWCTATIYIRDMNLNIQRQQQPWRGNRLGDFKRWIWIHTQ